MTLPLALRRHPIAMEAVGDHRLLLGIASPAYTALVAVVQCFYCSCPPVIISLLFTETPAS